MTAGYYNPAVLEKGSKLEIKLQRQLNDARIGRGKNLAERAAGKAGVRIVEFRVVEDIEELRTKLQADEIASARSLPERRVLDEGKVIVVESRPTKCVSAQRAKATFVRAGPSREIDWDGKVRSIVRAHSEVVFPNLSRRREVRRPYLIRTISSVRTSACLLDSGVDGKR